MRQEFSARSVLRRETFANAFVTAAYQIQCIPIDLDRAAALYQKKCPYKLADKVHQAHPLSLAIRGSRVFSSTSGVMGPICLKRITPCLSITKVSGAPYTP